MKENVEKSSAIDTKTKRKNFIRNIFHLLDDFAYYCLIFPLLIVSVIIVYQSLRYPEKIPDAFGYKLFIILDQYMDESLDFGDLVFTKNILPQNLNIEDIIAYRNNDNTVTIHKIIDKKEETQLNDITGEEKTIINFRLKSSENELRNGEYVSEDKIEGIIVKKIAKVGYILFLIQDFRVLALIIIIILIIGLIIYYIAQQLDLRDMKKMQELEQKNKS